MLKFEILEPELFDSLAKANPRYRNVDDDNLGFSDIRTGTAYVRDTGNPEINKMILDHEFDHFFEANPSDEDEFGIRHKKGKKFFRDIFVPIFKNIIPGAMAGSALGPVGALVGGGLGGVQGAMQGKQQFKDRLAGSQQPGMISETGQFQQPQQQQPSLPDRFQNLFNMAGSPYPGTSNFMTSGAFDRSVFSPSYQRPSVANIQMGNNQNVEDQRRYGNYQGRQWFG